MQTAIANTAAESADVVIRSHERLLRHLASRFLTTGVSFDDLMQEGRIALWCSSRTWRPDGGANLWTYARRAVFASMLRCASAHVDETHETFDEESITGETESVEITMLVHECLATLNEEQREVVRRTMEGETFKAIGVSLGHSESWAHRVFHRAAEILRERAAGES